MHLLSPAGLVSAPWTPCSAQPPAAKAPPGSGLQGQTKGKQSQTRCWLFGKEHVLDYGRSSLLQAAGPGDISQLSIKEEGTMRLML